MSSASYFSAFTVQNYISIIFLALSMAIVGIPLWMKLAKDDGFAEATASKKASDLSVSRLKAQ